MLQPAKGSNGHSLATAWESTADDAVCVSRPRYVAVFELRGVAHRERVGVLGAEHLERGLVDLADGDDAGATEIVMMTMRNDSCFLPYCCFR